MKKFLFCLFGLLGCTSTQDAILTENFCATPNATYAVSFEGNSDCGVIPQSFIKTDENGNIANADCPSVSTSQCTTTSYSCNVGNSKCLVDFDITFSKTYGSGTEVINCDTICVDKFDVSLVLQ